MCARRRTGGGERRPSIMSRQGAHLAASPVGIRAAREIDRCLAGAPAQVVAVAARSSRRRARSVGPPGARAARQWQSTIGLENHNDLAGALSGNAPTRLAQGRLSSRLIFDTSTLPPVIFRSPRGVGRTSIDFKPPRPRSNDSAQQPPVCPRAYQWRGRGTDRSPAGPQAAWERLGWTAYEDESHPNGRAGAERRD